MLPRHCSVHVVIVCEFSTVTDSLDGILKLFKHEYTANDGRNASDELQEYVKAAAEKGTLWRDEYVEVKSASHLGSDEYNH